MKNTLLFGLAGLIYASSCEKSECLPGKNIFEVEYYKYLYSDGLFYYCEVSVSPMVLECEVKAGHEYRINGRVVNSSRWNSWIEDISYKSPVKVECNYLTNDYIIQKGKVNKIGPDEYEIEFEDGNKKFIKDTEVIKN